MKILFFTHHQNGTDGWSRYGLDLARGLQAQGHEVLCLVQKKAASAGLAEKAVLGQPLSYIANPFLAFKLARQIQAILTEFNPDIVHFIVEPYAATLPFLHLGRTRTVLSIHGTYATGHLLFAGLKRKLAFWQANRYYKMINTVIAVSHYTKNQALQYFPFLSEKIKVITNGVNGRNFFRSKIERPENTAIKNILFVGAIKGRKGIMEAVAALGYYARHYRRDFVYNIIGDYEADPAYYEAIKAKAADLGLADRIFFRDRVSEAELIKYYQAADLFLMLPRNDGIAFEGFGLVYLEANAYGVPCLGARDSGAAEAIIDGRTGYAVEPGDDREAAGKIDLILNKKAISRQDCLDWAAENDINKKIETVLALYQSQLN